MKLSASKKSAHPNRRVVLTVISVLYLLAFMNFIFDWYFLDWSLVVNGDTRDTMFRSTLGSPLWLDVLDDFLFNCSLVVSDGFLVGYYN